MIRKSFIFLDKISKKTERSIWSQGITDWNGFIERKELKGISKKRKIFYDKMLKKASKALFDDDIDFFKEHLPSTETWRLFNYYKDEAVYLDIEIERKGNNISVIGLYDGYNTNMFVKGINMDKKAIKEALSRYKLLITFNGSSFDIPNIKKYFNLETHFIHLDLRHLCNRINLKGGLKEIEKKLNLKRISDYEIRSGDPALLYRMWKGSGNPHYLDLLIQYNEEDIINLQPITEFAVRKAWGKRLHESR